MGIKDRTMMTLDVGLPPWGIVLEQLWVKGVEGGPSSYSMMSLAEMSSHAWPPRAMLSHAWSGRCYRRQIFQKLKVASNGGTR
jgi:hypothetical protein